MKNCASYYLFLMFSFFLFSNLNPNLIKDTFVRMSLNECRRVQGLLAGDDVLSLGQVDGQAVFKKVKIEAIRKTSTSRLIAITMSCGVLIVGEEEVFYNPEQTGWVVAKNLTIKDKFFSFPQGCLSIKKIDVLNLDKSVDLYEISIEEPHVYFVCDSGENSILVHNNFWADADLVLEYVAAGGEKSSALMRAVPWIAPILVPVILAAGAANAIKGTTAENKSAKNESNNQESNNESVVNNGALSLDQFEDNELRAEPWRCTITPEMYQKLKNEKALNTQSSSNEGGSSKSTADTEISAADEIYRGILERAINSELERLFPGDNKKQEEYKKAIRENKIKIIQTSPAPMPPKKNDDKKEENKSTTPTTSTPKPEVKPEIKTELGSKTGYNFKEDVDIDLRETGKTCADAVAQAFDKTETPITDFEVTKWGKDANGKSFPVEWRAKNGAEVNIDIGHTNNGPDVPHVGYQTGGKRGSGGAVRGHILVDNVPQNR